jgi:hypothetical protein
MKIIKNLRGKKKKTNQWPLTYKAGVLTTPLHDILAVTFVYNIHEVIMLCVCVCGGGGVTSPTSTFQPADGFS